MARRSDHSREEIKEMALDAAEAIITEKGIEGLSARKVAQQIGYTVGTLYLVFKNQDDLILHINARTLDRLYERIAIQQSNVTGKESHQQAIMNLATSYIEFAHSENHLWKTLFDHQVDKDGKNVAWYTDRVSKLFAEVEQQLTKIAPEKTEHQIKIASRALWSGIHGVCILSIAENLDLAGIESADDLSHSLIENYIKGFTA